MEQELPFLKSLLKSIVSITSWVFGRPFGYSGIEVGCSHRVFGLKSSFLNNKWLQVILDGKSSQKYPVNDGVPRSSVLAPTLFLLYINDLPDFICKSAVFANDTDLCSKCCQATDLWQQLMLA